MNAFIESDPVTRIVRVWLYRQAAYDGGTVFMWPVGYQDDSKAMTWMQELVPEGQARPDTIRPALEMTAEIWEAFVKALRAVEMEIPAGKLLYKVLEREQNRVDALIQALIKSNEPQWIMSTKPPEGI